MNPFSVTNLTPNERGVFGDSRRIRSAFLFRVIQIGDPQRYQIVYDGWWFRQKVEVNDVLVWWKISWLTIARTVEFRIPPQIDPNQPQIDPNQKNGRIEIEFTRGLMIRRFRLWIDDTLVYDEIN